jgi:catechol 2,3-dioxygenase-like lactoylglutathione lyase family enzyme
MTTTITDSVVDAFTATASSRNDVRLRRRVLIVSLSGSNSIGDNGSTSNDDVTIKSSSSSSSSSSSLMSETSFLSHVMLKVPSVDKSVSYWTGDDMGGKVTRSKGNGLANGEGELLSAFVEMGRSTSTRYSSNDDDEKDDTATSSSSPPPAFSLELLKTNKETYSVGNIISYIGISKLLQFQNNLLGAIIANDGKQVQKKEIEQEQEEPNGIPIKSVASAPGDYIAQFTLKSKNLTSTSDFYTAILGMDNKAQDDKLLCLRYNNNDKSSSSLGVPTTLVFENFVDDDNDDVVLEKGDCFDHIAIQTTSSNIVDNLYKDVVSQQNNNVFMKPTTMFGMKVIGLLDPNGYKVVIAGK